MQIENADERLLRIVSSICDNYLIEDSSSLRPMTLVEKKAIEEAIIQVSNNQTISHELVMENTKKRYSKYFNDEN